MSNHHGTTETGTAEMLIAGKAKRSVKRTREHLVRSVIQTSLIFTLGLPTFVAFETKLAFGQQCDICSQPVASHAGPTCGCETKLLGSRTLCDGPASQKACGSPKTCEPTFAEKFLKKMDKLGDEFEAKHGLNKPAKAVSPKGSPTCGCESSAVAGPTCGCEMSSQPSFTMSAVKPIRSLHPVRPFPNVPPSQQSLGTIGDQPSSLPPIVQAKPSQSTIPPSIHSSPVVPQSTQLIPPLVQSQPLIEEPPSLKPVPLEGTPTPSMQDMPKSNDIPLNATPPFQKRTPSADPPPRRLPADEQLRESIPSLPPAQRTPTLPPKAEPTLPDVLVDPFKDDATTMNVPGTVRGIRLTTANPASTNSDPSVIDAIATSSRSKLSTRLRPKSTPETESKAMVVAPEKLTPKQRDVSKQNSVNSILEIGPATSSEAKPSGVVSSAYHEVVPRRNLLREGPLSGTTE